MDQPHNRNALTPALLNGLAGRVAAAAADPSVRVAVLTHTGPAFCAGADLTAGGSAAVSPRAVVPRDDRHSLDAPAAGSYAPHPPAGYAPHPPAGLADVLAAIQDSPKPVVARIAGHCFGGGVGLAAVCDLSVAADGARFGFTEVRVGVAPAIVSVVVLPKLRRGDALELFLSGERITAARAAESGLITRCVPADELDEAVVSLTAKLLAGGPSALAAAKQLVYRVPGMERDAALRWATELSASLFASAEAAEGMAAFREKRPASWVPPG
jgi:methylglutaconyl-CoA hydratase